jgi:protoporphyrinogen oxidase
MKPSTIVLGGGITGLAAAMASRAPVYESSDHPGGICSSYYLRPYEGLRLMQCPEDGEAYRFEIGGGHWIFGGDALLNHFICALAPARTYTRRSSVYFKNRNLYVPYPLQNHLSFLDKATTSQALSEMAVASTGEVQTLAQWLEQTFGPTLTRLFFAPFHELYTAGLWCRIAPQDGYKSPLALSQAIQGALGKAPAVGYNASFLYPENGLDAIVRAMANRCQVHYHHRVVHIDLQRRRVHFADGEEASYANCLATLPLSHLVELADLPMETLPAPHTSVLVLNIGAVKGPRCPSDHWLYTPDSQAGFHRIGFYSNVDPSFLPASRRDDRTSIYIERSFKQGENPAEAEVKSYTDAVILELQEMGFIQEVEAVDPTWIEVAYTWAWPGSGWKQEAMAELETHGVFPVGRYGRWNFQGIAASIKDGFQAGSCFKWD